MPWLPSKLQISTTKNFVIVKENSYSSRFIPKQRISSWFDGVLSDFYTCGSSETHGIQIKSAQSKVEFEIKIDNIQHKGSRPKFYIAIKMTSDGKTEFEKEDLLVDGTKFEPHYIGIVFDKLTACGVEIVRNGIRDTKRDGTSLKDLEGIAHKFVLEDETLKKAANSKEENIDATATCCDGFCCPMIGDFMRSRRNY
jgi:hypothetical protein